MEKPNHRGANNFVVGLFIIVAAMVAGGFVVFMGGGSLFGGEKKILTSFDDVKGLTVGAPVYLSGIQVGRVAEILFPDENRAKSYPQAERILVKLNIFKDHAPQVRKDSEASISTMGMLGDKVLMLAPGTPASGMAESGTLLPSEKPKELSDYFAQGADVVTELKQAAGNLNLVLKDLAQGGKMKSLVANLDKMSSQLSVATKDDLGPALKSLKSVLAKVDSGEGTLGALVNDSSLHEDLRVLLGGAKRSKVLRFMVRQAISNAEEKDAAQTPNPKKPTPKK